MHVARADPDQPDLSTGNASSQLVTRLQFILIDLIRAALDVDGCEFPLVLGRQVGTVLHFINLIATSGKLLFVVAALGRCHELSPVPRAACDHRSDVHPAHPKRSSGSMMGAITRKEESAAGWPPRSWLTPGYRPWARPPNHLL